MRFRAARMMPVLFILLPGCDPVPVQYPPGTSPYPSAYPATQGPSQGANLPSPGTPSSPQISGSQHTEYVWQKMMEGVAMGGAVGGPFGAGGGLIIGLINGLLTADADYAQLNAKIQAEEAKDKELEAQIELEIARQRELEAQLRKAEGISEPRQREEVQIAQRTAKETKMDKKEDLKSLASLGKKEIYRPPFKNVEIRDINQDGVPDLWIYYNPLKPQEIVRQEEDTNGDGRVDTWSAFKDGKLARREGDTKGNGRPDTIYYYEDDKISREERDENGDGRPSFRATYQNGRLAKVEKDLDRDGKIDLWVYYDTTKDQELVLKEESDLNGNGAIDLWSHYQNGRLVRRDVSAVGLQHLSEQEKPAPEASSLALPKS